MPKFLFLALIPAAFCLAPLAAQEGNSSKQMRFIALGEEPPLFDPASLPLDGHLPLPGPPRQLSVVSTVSGKSRSDLLLTLCSFSKTVTLKADMAEVTLEAREEGRSHDWLTFKTPAHNLSLGVLHQDPKTMTWEKPKILVLADDPESFPAEMTRFVNLSEEIVLVQVGDPSANPTPKTFGIRPGKSRLQPLKIGSNQLRVGYLDGARRLRWIWSNEVQLDPNERLQCFFYKAKGKAPRDPVRFHHQSEPVPRIPPE